MLDDEPVEENTYLSSSYVVGTSRDTLLNVAFTVLEYVLLDAPGAPVKQALLDAGGGEKMSAVLSRTEFISRFSQSSPKMHGRKTAAVFCAVIKETLRRLVKEGLDQKALASGINFFEFRFREADYATYPKGLIYGIDLFAGWLYDDKPAV